MTQRRHPFGIVAVSGAYHQERYVQHDTTEVRQVSICVFTWSPIGLFNQSERFIASDSISTHNGTLYLTGLVGHTARMSLLCDLFLSLVLRLTLRQGAGLEIAYA